MPKVALHHHSRHERGNWRHPRRRNALLQSPQRTVGTGRSNHPRRRQHGLLHPPTSRSQNPVHHSRRPKNSPNLLTTAPQGDAISIHHNVGTCLWRVSIPTRNVSTHQKHAKGISLRYNHPRIGNLLQGLAFCYWKESFRECN